MKKCRQGNRLCAEGGGIGGQTRDVGLIDVGHCGSGSAIAEVQH